MRCFTCAPAMLDGMDRMAMVACEVNVVLAVVRQVVIADVIAAVTCDVSLESNGFVRK